MAMEKMEINTEALERLIDFVDSSSWTCDECPFFKECQDGIEETCANSLRRILTTPSTKNYMVKARIDGWVHIPVVATSKEEAYKIAETKAREMVEDYVSFEIDIDSNSITEI